MKEKDGDIQKSTQNPVFNMQGSNINTMITSTTFSGSITINKIPNLHDPEEISKDNELHIMTVLIMKIHYHSRK